MREQILALLSEVAPTVDFEASSALVDDGILDSFSVVNIISELSIEYGVTVPFEEVTADNFNSIDAITALVERLKVIK